MKLHIIGSDNYCHSVDVFNWDFPIHVGDDVNVTAKIAVNAHGTKEEVDQLASIIGMRQ